MPLCKFQYAYCVCSLTMKPFEIVLQILEQIPVYRNSVAVSGAIICHPHMVLLRGNIVFGKILVSLAMK